VSIVAVFAATHTPSKRTNLLDKTLVKFDYCPDRGTQAINDAEVSLKGLLGVRDVVASEDAVRA
jgi:hypothetical protein